MNTYICIVNGSQIAVLVSPTASCDRITLVTAENEEYAKIQIREAIREEATLNKLDYIFIKQKDSYKKCPFNQILWVEAAGSYSNIKLINSSTFVVAFPLAEIYPKLDSHCFMRVHRSFIVNLDHVTSFVGNTIYINNVALPVSRSCRSQLIRRLNILSNIKDDS